MNESDRRKYQRVPVELVVSSSSSEGELLEMQTINLSLGGAYCRVNQDIPAMTKMEVRIQLKLVEPTEDDWINAEAICVRSTKAEHGYYIALYFSYLSDEDQKKLRRFLFD